jgi:RecA-family ATPase
MLDGDDAYVIAKVALEKGVPPLEAVELGLRGLRPPGEDALDPFGPIQSHGYRTLGALVMDVKNRSETKWIIPGFLPAGLTILAGAPKAGKSFVVLDLAFSVAIGGSAMGTMPTVQHSAFYLALEDHDTRIHQRLMSLQPNVDDWPLENLSILTMTEASQGGVRVMLDHWFKTAPKPGLVVVDTLGSYRQLMAQTASDAMRHMSTYDSDVALLRPLQRWTAERDLALLIVHHTNQTRWEEGDDWMAKISGTSGLTGTADQMMLLKTQRGSQIGEMLVAGREIEDGSLDLYRTGPWWMVTGGMR